jgi:Caspase domain
MRAAATWRAALVLIALAGAPPWVCAQQAVVDEAQALIAQGRAVEAATRLEAARLAAPDDRAILQALIRAHTAQRGAARLPATTNPAPVVARVDALRVTEPQTAPRTNEPQTSLRVNEPQTPLRVNEPQTPLRVNEPQTPLRVNEPQPPLRVAAPIAASPTPPRSPHAASPLAAPPEGAAHALVIGIDRYRQHAPLLTAVADARLVGALLRERYGFAVETVENATRRQVLDALAQLRKRVGANDRVLVYYAGHGVQDDATGRGYWLPVDAERDNVANWVSNGDVADMLQGLTARHALVIADSCFAGTLARGASAPRPDARPDALQRLAARRSRAVLTSGGLEPVLDSGAGRHSIFARALVDVLASQGEAVEAGRVFTAVRDRMVRVADQTPQYAAMHDAGHEGGEFIFTPIAAVAVR